MGYFVADLGLLHRHAYLLSLSPGGISETFRNEVFKVVFSYIGAPAYAMIFQQALPYIAIDGLCSYIQDFGYFLNSVILNI